MSIRSTGLRAVPTVVGETEITEVRVRLHRGGPGDILRAFASITLNNCFAVHNLKVIDKDGVLFVSMPARRNRDGQFSDIAHPIHREFREYMESVVLTAYEREQDQRRVSRAQC